MPPLHITIAYWLVAVSVLISIIASYSAFSFAERVAKSRGGAYVFWLASGAAAMGLGIWSMHYLGMLAVRLPVEVLYHVPTVLLSLLLAVLASLVALFLVSRPRLNLRQLTAGSLLMGGGIGAMHYTGMHAMRCAAMHAYRPWLVAASVVVAVVFSWMSLWIAFAMRTRLGGRRLRRGRPVRQDWLRRELIRLGGAALMGLGIAAMHYTAMAAVSFLPDRMAYSSANAIHITTLGIGAVACTTAIVLFGALVTALLDRRVYEQISLERDRWQAMAECSMDSLYLCEALRNENGRIVDFVITYANANAVRTAGLDRDTMIGGRLCELLPMVRTLGHFDHYKRVVYTGVPLVVEFSLPGSALSAQPSSQQKGETAWLRIQAVKLRDGIAITAADITARKRDEERILHLAHHDPLTGLINRGLLTARIQDAIDRARRYGGQLAVFLLDLDHFKSVNDTLGHAAGDAVLVEVAARLRAAVRSVDSVVRIGGDEFVVIMPGVGERRDLEACARRLMRLFESRVPVQDKSIAVGCSMGIAVYPESALTVDELLSHADAAMYAVKRRGKSHYEIHAPRIQQLCSDSPAPEPAACPASQAS